MLSPKRTLPLLLVLLLANALNSLAGDGLQPWKANPWYWSYDGDPVLLLGGTDDDNLFQWPASELVPHLDRLAAAGGNVIRNTMSDRHDRKEVYAFLQLENGKYDLEQWNPVYWDRFERLLRETARRRIVVQIEVWDRFDLSRDHWPPHPYNPANNVNYSFEASGFVPEYPNHPGKNEQPFFFTTPKQQNNRVVLTYQQRFVDKLLDHSLNYDHVLYCMDNETNAEAEWGRYWARYIQQRAQREGKVVYTTEMWDPWDLRDPMHKRTFDHPELYAFVDVSQNNHNSGQLHWDLFCDVRQVLAHHPRPMNSTKIYGADGNKFGHTDQDAIERFWRHLLAGGASVRFHRPDGGMGLNEKTVACIKAARLVESKVLVWTLEPANELLAEREENEAYLAASPDRAAVAYFPSGGEVQLLIPATRGLAVHWVDIDAGQWGPFTMLTSPESVTLSAPGPGNWAAVILPGF